MMVLLAYLFNWKNFGDSLETAKYSKEEEEEFSTDGHSEGGISD